MTPRCAQATLGLGRSHTPTERACVRAYASALGRQVVRELPEWRRGHLLALLLPPTAGDAQPNGPAAARRRARGAGAAGAAGDCPGAGAGCVCGPERPDDLLR